VDLRRFDCAHQVRDGADLDVGDGQWVWHSWAPLAASGAQKKEAGRWTRLGLSVY
jgi:hypothetical protein